MTAPQIADLAMLERAMGEVFSPYVQQLGLRLVAAAQGEVTLDLPVLPLHVHAGGVLCGQSMMAAADSAMVLAVMSKLGAFRPMTTVQLQTSFLKPIAGNAGTARVIATVLRLGKNLAFGEIRILAPNGDLAAHATTTYALL